MSTRCIQIVAFNIKPERLEDFAALKARIAADAHKLPGLLQSTTQRSLSQPGAFVDTMVWESEQAAEEGNKVFETLPTTPAFMSMMAGPPAFAGHFAWTAGDSTLELSA